MKKDQLKVFIVASLVIAVCAFGYATYAFFQTTYTGTASGTLAASWDFDFLGKPVGDAEDYQTLVGSTHVIDLAKSCTKCVTGKDGVVKLQPGSEGNFSIKVDAKDSSVATSAVVTMSSLSIEGGTDFPDITFYYVDDKDATQHTLTVANLKTGAQIYKNTWAADVAEKNGVSTVYWKWNYDSANDNKFAGKTITFALKAEAKQEA